MNDDDLHVIQSRTRLKSEIFFEGSFFFVLFHQFLCVSGWIFSQEKILSCKCHLVDFMVKVPFFL